MRHPLQTFYQTWSHKYCEIDPGCCGFRVSSVVDPQQYAYYYLKPDMGDYDFRIAVHTVNDNLDLYTTVGTTRHHDCFLRSHVGARIRALGAFSRRILGALRRPGHG